MLYGVAISLQCYMLLQYHFNRIVGATIWEPNKIVDIWEWSTCGGGRLKRLCCICVCIRITIVLGQELIILESVGNLMVSV